MNILFSRNAWDEYVAWQSKDRRIVAKINTLIKDISRNGMLAGLGQPEPLKHGLSGVYSRRITQEHRLVYAQDAHGNLLIVKCTGHYE